MESVVEMDELRLMGKQVMDSKDVQSSDNQQVEFEIHVNRSFRLDLVDFELNLQLLS